MTGSLWSGPVHGLLPSSSKRSSPVQRWVVVLITQVIGVGEVIVLGKVLILLFLLFFLGLSPLLRFLLWGERAAGTQRSKSTLPQWVLIMEGLRQNVGCPLENSRDEMDGSKLDLHLRRAQLYTGGRLMHATTHLP